MYYPAYGAGVQTQTAVFLPKRNVMSILLTRSDRSEREKSADGEKPAIRAVRFRSAKGGEKNQMQFRCRESEPAERSARNRSLRREVGKAGGSGEQGDPEESFRTPPVKCRTFLHNERDAYLRRKSIRIRVGVGIVSVVVVRFRLRAAATRTENRYAHLYNYR